MVVNARLAGRCSDGQPLRVPNRARYRENILAAGIRLPVMTFGRNRWAPSEVGAQK